MGSRIPVRSAGQLIEWQKRSHKVQVVLLAETQERETPRAAVALVALSSVCRSRAPVGSQVSRNAGRGSGDPGGPIVPHRIGGKSENNNQQ